MAKGMKVMKAKALSKSGVAEAIANATTLKKSDVAKVLDSLTATGCDQVKKTGKFIVPGLVMIKTRKKAARKAGTRLAFGKMIKVKAAPAKNVVKAFCVKAIKDAV